MTREPDRFDKQARELFSIAHNYQYADGAIAEIAAALRAAEASALERAAQAFDERGPDLLREDTGGDDPDHWATEPERRARKALAAPLSGDGEG